MTPLAAEGADVMQAPSFRTLAVDDNPDIDVYGQLLQHRIDVVDLHQRRGCRGFAALYGEDQVADLLAHTTVATVGPAATEAVRRLGVDPAIVPPCRRFRRSSTPSARTSSSIRAASRRASRRRSFRMLLSASAAALAPVPARRRCALPPAASAAATRRSTCSSTNARIIDGTGAPAREGARGRGRRTHQRRARCRGRPAAAGRATRVVDAKGRVVAPGFIDMHSHSDMPLVTDGNAQSKIRQGVTTEVIGESGSIAPQAAADRHAAVDRLRRLFRRCSRSRASRSTCCPYVGLGTARELVVGNDNRPATADELPKMQELVDARR